MRAPAARAAATWHAARATVREHPRHLVLFALAAGLACGSLGVGWAVVPALGALVLGAGRPVATALAVAAVLGGAVAGDARRAAVEGGLLPARLGAEVALEVVALEPVRERASGEAVARVAPAAGPASGEPLLLRARDRSALPGVVEPGEVLAVRGRLAALREFDAIQRRRGALAGLEVHEAARTGRRRGGLAGALDAVRRRAQDGLARGLPAEQSALLQGMTLGRDDGIDAATAEDFRASGLAHLLAVSGTNVMLLATLVLAAGALLGVPLRLRLGAALVLVALYVPLTGAGPSIQRAGVMGAAGLVAALAGRPSSRWYAVGLAAAATLAVNPHALRDVGWQLSFAAVAGLLWLAPPLRAALRRRRVPAALAEAGAMTVAATVATAPLMAAHFEQVSLVSLPANVLVAPVVAPVMWLGMLAAAVAQAAPEAAVPLNAVNAPLVGFVDRVAHLAARAPGAVAEVRLGGPAGALAGYAALAAAALVARGALRRLRAAAPRPGRPAVAAALVAVAATGAVAVAAPGAGPGPAPGETVVSFLDVGQGDAILVQRGARAVLFDTGPPDGGVADALRDAGVDRLDVLVLTHAQADHEGAALEVLSRFRPGLVVDGGAGWPSPVQRALPRAAAAAGARVVRAAAGDVLRIGALEVRVLWPPPELAQAPAEGDANDRALVALVRSGALDVLLTGDAESSVTSGLDLPDVDVLKVAHHGSEDAALPAALARLRPEVAAIQVGRDNRYGHPAPSTLAALRVVPTVLRTDRHGTVRLRAAGGRLRVEASGT